MALRPVRAISDVVTPYGEWSAACRSAARNPGIPEEAISTEPPIGGDSEEP